MEGLSYAEAIFGCADLLREIHSALNNEEDVFTLALLCKATHAVTPRNTIVLQTAGQKSFIYNGYKEYLEINDMTIAGPLVINVPNVYFYRCTFHSIVISRASNLSFNKCILDFLHCGTPHESLGFHNTTFLPKRMGYAPEKLSITCCRKVFDTTLSNLIGPATTTLELDCCKVSPGLFAVDPCQNFKSVSLRSCIGSNKMMTTSCGYLSGTRIERLKITECDINTLLCCNAAHVKLDQDSLYHLSSWLMGIGGGVQCTTLTIPKCDGHLTPIDEFSALVPLVKEEIIFRYKRKLPFLPGIAFENLDPVVDGKRSKKIRHQGRLITISCQKVPIICGSF